MGSVRLRLQTEPTETNRFVDGRVYPQVLSYSHKVLAVGLLFAADLLLMQLFASYGIAFPSALGGMFIILGTFLRFDAPLLTPCRGCVCETSRKAHPCAKCP